MLLSNSQFEEERAKQERMRNLNTDGIRKAINAHDEQTLKDMGFTQEIKVQVYSGLLATTPIIIDDDIQDFYKLYLMHGEELTLGVNLNNGQVVNTHIIGVPEEVMVDRYCTLEFSCGLKIQCTVATQILAYNEKGEKEFKDASKLQIGQRIVGFGIREDNGIGERTFILDNRIDETNIIGIPAYFFMAEHENVMIPYAGEHNNGDVMSFIVVHQ